MEINLISADFFNLTMTYRWDSDVPRPYGWIEPIDQPFTAPPTDKNPIKWRQYNEKEFM